MWLATAYLKRKNTQNLLICNVNIVGKLSWNFTDTDNLPRSSFIKSKSLIPSFTLQTCCTIELVHSSSKTKERFEAAMRAHVIKQTIFSFWKSKYQSVNTFEFRLVSFGRCQIGVYSICKIYLIESEEMNRPTDYIIWLIHKFFSIFFSVTSVSAFLAFSFQKLVGKCLYMPQL